MKKILWKKQKDGRLVLGNLDCVVWPRGGDVMAWSTREFLGYFETVHAAKTAALEKREKRVSA